MSRGKIIWKRVPHRASTIHACTARLPQIPDRRWSAPCPLTRKDNANMLDFVLHRNHLIMWIRMASLSRMRRFQHFVRTHDPTMTLGLPCSHLTKSRSCHRFPSQAFCRPRHKGSLQETPTWRGQGRHALATMSMETVTSSSSST